MKRGIARLEYLCLDAYNECDVLLGATGRYHERTGYYPKRVLADQIYRNRANRAYCKKHGICISGPALGRPHALSAEEKKQAYADNTGRIEAERRFSLAKRCYGLGLIKTKLDTTTCCSTALSILAMNVNYLEAAYFCVYLILVFSRYKWQKNLTKELIFSICA